jgi:hypothetical protein
VRRVKEDQRQKDGKQHDDEWAEDGMPSAAL